MVVPAAYLVLRRGDEVLLQLRSGTGYMDDHWAVGAAGHVEKGESVVEAIQREATEELGITLAVEDLMPVCTLHRTRGGYEPTEGELDERVDFFFTASGWTGDPRIMEPNKSADLRWYPLASLPHPVVPHELGVLEAIRRAEVSGEPVPSIITSGF
jgi:8-oxo-dGTP diphosphatase